MHQKHRKKAILTKKYTPRLVRLTDDALKTIPEALKNALPTENLAYAVRPEDSGAICISDAPDAVGHICAFISAKDVEFLPKTTAKSPKVSVSVTIDTLNDAAGSEQTLMIAVPENMTDAELLAAVRAAGPNLAKYRESLTPDENKPMPEAHELLAMYLTEFGPGEASVLTPDLHTSITL